MVKELFATPGAGQESEIFAFASDVDADQRMEIERMGTMLKVLVKELSAMRSVVAGCLSSPHRGRCSARWRISSAAAAGSGPPPTERPADHRSARRPQAGLARRRRGGPQHGTDREPAEAGRLLRSESAGRQADRARASAHGARRPRRRRSPPGEPTSEQSDGALRSRVQPAGLRELRPRVQGAPRLRRQYHGFNTYNVERPNRPKLLASVVCPGGQGDVSVHGNLLFMSVEQTRGRLDCGTQGVQTPVSVERFRGVRIFDITDLAKPKQVAAVQTCRGSHTHTLVTDPNDKANLYVYGSGTGAVRPAEELAGCSWKPKDDPNTALFSIDVIQVPLAAPENAKIVNRPRIFADPATGSIAGLWQGGNHGAGTQTSRMTNQCHDITVFPEIGLAAGACSGNGILLDISDPMNPVRLDHVVDKSFAYWHSATFNNDGTKVIFTDEWGGGTPAALPRDRSARRGAPTPIFDVVDRKLTLRRVLQDAGAADRAGELRRAQRLAHPGAGARHHGAGVVPGRRLGVRLHRLGEAGRDRVLRSRADRREEADHRRLLVDLLVQRPHLRIGDRPRHRRLQAEAERVPLAERDRRRHARSAVDELNAQQQTRITWPASLAGGAAPTSIS